MQHLPIVGGGILINSKFMADTIEKVYCTGDGGNGNLATALLARGNNNDPMAMMAVWETG